MDWQRSQYSNQQQFQKHIDSMIDIFGKCENPFTEELQDGLVLDSQDLVDSYVPLIPRIGEEQFQAFLSSRFALEKKSLYDPIKYNNIHILSSSSN